MNQYSRILVVCILVFSGLLLISCVSKPILNSEALRSPAADASLLIPGTTYIAQVGQNGLGGKAKLVTENGRYKITLPLRIVGGVLFGKTNPKTAQQISRLPTLPPANFFKKNAKSIEDIPALRQRVLDLLNEIEQIFKTDFFALQIEPQFVANEALLLDKEELKLGKTFINYQTALNKGIVYDRLNTEVMTITITPQPNPDFVSPTLWNPFDEAYLLAHEMGHILGISAEGFTLKGYPLLGLLTDAYALHVLRKNGRKESPKLTRIDFNSMMQNIIHNLNPRVDVFKGEKLFQPTIESTFQKSKKNGYYGLTHEEKIQAMELEFNQQF